MTDDRRPRRLSESSKIFTRSRRRTWSRFDARRVLPAWACDAKPKSWPCSRARVFAHPIVMANETSRVERARPRFRTVASSSSRILAGLAMYAFGLSLVAACALDGLSTNLGSSRTPSADGGASSSSSADAGIQGAGCTRDTESGQVLCTATSLCPNVVVDTGAFPGCGFRIEGAAVDLVCGCAGLLCPMGAFKTCAQASQLLLTQNQQGICMQLGEDRCFPPTSASSSGKTPGSKNTCDSECLAQCGGGAACASLCGC